MPGRQRSVSASSMRTSQRAAGRARARRASWPARRPASRHAAGPVGEGAKRPSGPRLSLRAATDSPEGGLSPRSTFSASERPERKASSTRCPVHQSPPRRCAALASHRWGLPTGTWVCASGQQRACACEGSARMPVISAKARSSLASTREASSRRCSCDQAALACRVQRSMRSRPGLEDSRASQATRWCVLRAAFHCGPRCDMVGWLACGKAIIRVQQGAMRTASILLARLGGQLAVAAAGRACRARRHGQQHARRSPSTPAANRRGPRCAAASAWRRAHRARCGVTCVRVHERVAQRGGPVRHQRIHAGLGHPVRLARGQGGLGHAAVRVEHAHEVGAPGPHSCGAVSKRARKARIAHGEVLRAAVEAAEGRGFARHAAAGARRLRTR